MPRSLSITRPGVIENAPWEELRRHGTIRLRLIKIGPRVHGADLAKEGNAYTSMTFGGCVDSSEIQRVCERSGERVANGYGMHQVKGLSGFS